MIETISQDAAPIRLRRYFWLLAGLWTLVVGAILAWELLDEREHVMEIARSLARGAFEKDLAFRRWNAEHGGVYVPVTPTTPPNPHLAESPERDITTPLGRKLTLVNPSYMIRQVHELAQAEDESGLRSHLTSLRPVRPENAPDPWEREALAAFERGEDEYSSEALIDGKRYVRLMRPLVTEKACLNCHLEHGYKVGDVRGGISVSVPWDLLWPTQKQEIIDRSLGYGAVWLLGLLGIVLGSRRLRRQISRQRQAEGQLRESQVRIREIAANIPGVVYQYLHHPDGTFEFPYISERVAEIIGVTPEQVQSDPPKFFPGMLHEEDIVSIFESINESIKNMTTWRREMQCKTADGEIKCVRATSRPHRLADGSVLFDGVFLDITEHRRADKALQDAHDLLEHRVAERTAELQQTNQELEKEIVERKRAERWLLESEERFRSYFDLGLIGMAITSPQKEWLEVNGRLCEMLGYSEAELISKTWAEVTHPDDLPADEAQFDRVLAGVMNGYSMDKRFVRQDGQTVHANISVRCLRKPDGKVDCFVTLIQDITERKRTEERYRALFEGLGDAALVADTQTGEIVDVNKQAEILLGRPRKEIVGMHQAEVYAAGKQERCRKEFQQYVAKRSRGECAAEVVRKDGTLVPVVITSTYISLDGRKRIVGLFRDVSELVEMRTHLSRESRAVEDQ